MAKDAPELIRAAGGVVWRPGSDGVEVALVHRPRYDDWSLPKGKLDPGEGELTAAVREVGEELGAQVTVSRFVRRIGYDVGPARKRVDFWTMRHIGGDFAANAEVDSARWLAVPAARAALSYGVERDVLDAFAALPVPDSLVVLVRHAKAGKRSEWDGDDRARPLDPAGVKQARRLVGFLRRFGPGRVLSADPVRCVQTVQPLADDIGVPVEIERTVGDLAWEADPDAGIAAVTSLAERDRVTVVSSQGDAIPGLVSALAPDVGNTSTRKGAAWVLSFADGVLLGADYYRNAAR